MFICVCFAVSDQQVREAISDGADTVEAVTRACQAGGDCGACRGAIEEMIDEASPDGSSKRRLPTVPPSTKAA